MQAQLAARPRRFTDSMSPWHIVASRIAAVKHDFGEAKQPLTPRLMQLTRLAKGVLPTAMDNLAGHASEFLVVEKKLELIQPFREAVAQLPDRAAPKIQ